MIFLIFLSILRGCIQTPDLENTVVQFEITHMGVLTVEGRFDQISGVVEESEGGWRVVGEISVESIQTGNSSRDKTLLTEQYLNADEFPVIPFVAEIFESTIDIEAELRGIPVSFNTSMKYQENQFTSETIVIDRKEIGLDFGAMDSLIGDEIRVSIQTGIKNP